MIFEKERNVEETIRALIERLALRGLALSSIPSYIRNAANSISGEPHMTLDEINTTMESLGWDDFKLDDHTLQLIFALLAEHTDMGPGHPLWQRAAPAIWISRGSTAHTEKSGS
jgi:hypothetical protein